MRCTDNPKEGHAAKQGVNPEGIPSFSPGLRGTSYPGWAWANFNNPEGGLHPSKPGNAEAGHNHDTTAWLPL